MRLEPAMHSGGLLKLYQAMWAPYYDSVMRLLGSTGVILPFGDPHHGQPNASTFTTKGDERITFTWSEAPGSFDSPIDLGDPDSFQGIIPIIRLNGSDEEADTPDAAIWSPGDGANDSAFSVSAWIRITADGESVLLARYDTTGGTEEWRIAIITGYLLELRLADQSAAVSVTRTSDAGISQDVWTHVVFTYDGTGGADAMGASGAVQDNATLYFNGEIVASTAADNAGYVAMENLAGVTGFGHRPAASPLQYFAGDVAGGPLGPTWALKELTPDEVRALYDLGRAALGV